MTLQETIKNDLKEAMRAKDAARTSAIRVILGEFQRQAAKELSDDQVVAILRKLVKAEEETMAKGGKTDPAYLQTLQGYLPQQADEAEIRAWIEANVDFASLKSPMQAMKPIMAHFGPRAEGNTVRRILESMVR